MATSVTLPALGESVTEGTVTRWLKQEGDTVEADEPLLEVSTDKVDTEIPSPAAGTLLSIKVQEDETVEVGAELAVIGTSDDEGGDAGGSEPESGGAESGRSESGGAESGGSDAGDQASGGAAAEDEPEAVADPVSDPGSAGDAAPQPAAGSQSATDDGEQASAPAGSEATGSQASAGSAGSVSVTLPALGESVTEGTVTRWLKQEGDRVEADEPLLEVSTDKVDTEIPSPAAGTLLSIKVQEDETVEVGAELAVIGAGADGDSVAGAGSDQSSAGRSDGASTDDSAVATDEQPAAVAEKIAAEKQEAEIQSDSSTSAPPGGRGATDGSSSSPGSSSAASSTPASSSQPKPLTQAPPAAPAPAAPDGAAGDDGVSAQRGDSGPGDGPYVTPLVRKLATEAGIDLGSITGTGVGGRIRKQDVLAATSAREAEVAAAAAEQQTVTTEPAAAQSDSAADASSTAGATSGAASTSAEPRVGAPASASLRGQTVKMTRMRSFIAKRMVESLQVSAQLTTVVEVDVTQIARLRNQAKAAFQEREGVRLSFLPFFAKASIEALRAYPQVNSSINSETNEVTYHAAEHLGIAVDTERGLIVPVIQNAGDLNIGGLARKIADLADRTRNNKVTPDELAGGTFTLTNTGSRGALFDTPILNQPQVGILGTGAVVKRPVVIDDPRLGETIVVRSMVYLALTYDHRIVDGADAARFLTYMKQRLEEGKFESDLGL